MGLIPTFMIVVKDNPVSEYYASVAIPSWTEYGYDVQVFDAITPTRHAPFKLEFGPSTKSVKYIRANIEKQITATERAVWYSHVSLWLKCIELNQNIMVLEHDCYLTDPQNILVIDTVDFVNYDRGAMGCYVISPKLASYMCNELVTKQGIIRSGPLGYIRALVFKMMREDRNIFRVIFHDDKMYKNACNQIYNPDYKTTIYHYKDTEAEKHLDKIGYFEYILAETNKPIDPAKTIKVRTE